MTVDPYLWKNWLGYKHRVGADPRLCNKCCCLKLIQAIYEELNLGIIPFNQDWYRLAKAGSTQILLDIFHKSVVEIAYPKIWSLLLFNQSPRLGLGIVVQDSQYLIPYHKAGLSVYSLSTLPLENRRYFLPICS